MDFDKVITEINGFKVPKSNIKISVDVDGLVKYVMEKADNEYQDDFPINKIEHWIREFFEKK